PYLYNQAVWEVLENQSKIQNPNSEIERPVLFARSATAGCQKFPVHWGGDCWSDFPAMAESLRGGLSLCLSGFGFWSHDIGGFEGTPPASLFKRWIAFGLLSSHSRLHGSSSYRVPWLYDEESVDVLRFFTKLKLRLMPYLWAKAVEAHETGIPMMRAMHLEFPDDPACDTLDRQYMLGDALLVAPIFTDSGEVEFYVPEGRWTKLLTGEPIEGGRWYRDTHDPLSLPLLVRPNSLLALSSDDTSPEAALASEPILVPYSLESEASAITSDLTGIRRATFTARRLRSDLEWTYEGEAQQLNWALPAIGSDLLSGISLGSRGTVTRG
ncbi:MAG TPA: glycoside hydrolase family 31 protein, partial [Fimbriimonadaceae bacterium]|nr:glycoside hydrolase family 31 protein [Fimbriimonadaceae bacterium]